MADIASQGHPDWETLVPALAAIASIITGANRRGGTGVSRIAQRIDPRTFVDIARSAEQASIRSVRKVGPGATGPKIVSYNPGEGPLVERAGSSLAQLLSRLNPGAVGTGAGLAGAAGATIAGGVGSDVANSPTPGAQSIESQMRSLAAQGVPASGAWRQMQGDAPPPTGKSAQDWGTMYESFGGVNDMRGGAGAPPPPGGTPSPTPGAMPSAMPSAMPGGMPGAMPTPPPSLGQQEQPFYGVIPYNSLSPDSQMQADLEHGAGRAVPGVTQQTGAPGTILGAPAQTGIGTGAGGGTGTPPSTIGALAAQPPGGPGAPSPFKVPQDYLYDILNPEQSISNALSGIPGSPAYGPGLKWMQAYLQPAMLAAMSGSDLGPEGVKNAITSRYNGSDLGPDYSSILSSLGAGENKARDLMSANPGTDIRGSLGTDPGSQRALYAYMVNQGQPQEAANLVSAAMGSGPNHLGVGMRQILGQFLGDILQKQMYSNPNMGTNRIGYLNSILGVGGK